MLKIGLCLFRLPLECRGSDFGSRTFQVGSVFCESKIFCPFGPREEGKVELQQCGWASGAQCCSAAVRRSAVLQFFLLAHGGAGWAAAGKWEDNFCSFCCACSLGRLLEKVFLFVVRCRWHRCSEKSFCSEISLQRGQEPVAACLLK